MKSYKYWEQKFKQNDLSEFSKTPEGLLWLKLRSIERKELLQEFCKNVGVIYEGTSTIEKLWDMLNSSIVNVALLEKFMRCCQTRENSRIEETFEQIRTNLYKMKHFHWGGGFRNSLDKAIVTRYVKTQNIIPYNDLGKICETELLEMSRGYLINSWYNYWSSVLIENLFRRNSKVMPAYGKIKNVDFFVDDFPFDLKVTYLPKEYTKLIRKKICVSEPLKVLKTYAKKNAIQYGDGDPEQIQYEISERMADSDSESARKILVDIAEGWKAVVNEAMRDKKALIKWLYENQGDMRFGAENRIFLVLIDMENPEESWKLKRNVDLIAPKVNDWILRFNRNVVDSFVTHFTYNAKKYTTFADVIFVVKESRMEIEREEC